MGIRQTINENPIITSIATGVVLLLALAFVGYRACSSSRPNVRGAPDPKGYYFSSDDGATFFTDDIMNIPPFSKDGKEAVRAHVFACADGKKFVGYLAKFSDSDKKELEQQRERIDKGPFTSMLMMGLTAPPMIKKPGEKAWIASVKDPNYRKVMNPLCPDGQPAEQVMERLK